MQSFNESIFLSRIAELSSCFIPLNMEQFNFKKPHGIKSYQSESLFMQSSIPGILCYANILHTLSSKTTNGISSIIRNVVANPHSQIANQLSLLPFEITPKQLFKEAMKGTMNQRSMYDTISNNSKLCNDVKPFALHDSLSITSSDNKADIENVLYSLNWSKRYSYYHNDGNVLLPFSFPRIYDGSYDEKGRKLDKSGNSFIQQLPVFSEIVTSYTIGETISDNTLKWKGKFKTKAPIMSRFFDGEFITMDDTRDISDNLEEMCDVYKEMKYA